MSRANERTIDTRRTYIERTPVGQETQSGSNPQVVESVGYAALSSLDEVRQRVAAELAATHDKHLTANQIILLDQSLSARQEPLN